MMMAASDGGKGFMLRYPTPEDNEEAKRNKQQHWETEYKAFIKRTGAHICGLAYNGYVKEGRGAIYAKYTHTGSDPQSLTDVDKISGVPSLYVPLNQWMESAENDKDSSTSSQADLQHILERILSYDPEKQFVVVFETKDLMGADIVRPNIPPPEMAHRLVQHEEERQKEEGGDKDVHDIITVASRSAEE